MQWRKANVIMDVQCAVAVKMIKFHKITPFPACIIAPGGTGGKKTNQHNKEVPHDQYRIYGADPQQGL